MKSRLMRKLFAGNVLSFLLLLLFQLIFQDLLFEPYLASEQKKRLIDNMEMAQTAIYKGDQAAVRRQIQTSATRGVVMAAVDEQYQQVYGQQFDQYQRCFTMQDGQGEIYNIVEDYLESTPLQALEVGDEVSVDGYLVDTANQLVLPSKVYRAKDGVTFGVDTFLFVSPAQRASVTQPQTADSAGNEETATPADGILITDNSTPAGAGVTVSDSSDSATPTAYPHAVVAKRSQNKDGLATIDSSSGVQANENNLPTGFVLHSPFNLSSGENTVVQGQLLTGEAENSTLQAARILIVNSGGRSGSSFPITVTGRVIDRANIDHYDLFIQQSLISDEIKRHSESSELTVPTAPYTVSHQMTTGKYFLRVVHMADQKMTLIGVISLYSVKDMNGMMNTFHVLLFAAELAMLLLVLYFFSGTISKPLIEMNGVAMKIAQQDFSSRVNVASKDEIGTLGLSINTISANLEQKMNQINAINRQLQTDYQRQLEMQKRHRELSVTFSHELKTPLTIMRGCIDSIQGGSNPSEQVEYYGIALRELDRAGNLITQMLEIARMESPYFTLQKRPVDLWMVFYKVFDDLRPTFEQKGMQVVYEACEEATVCADAELLERVVSNALTNALKYSPNGSRIWVTITATQQQYTFTVVNGNSVIPAQELDKIWQPFYHSTQPNAGANNGTGLGLMIVSRILDAHGYAYGIENTDLGVAFHFTCPVLHAPTAAVGER